MDTKLCKKCNTILPISDFGFDKSTKDGLRYYCKACRSKMSKDHVARWKTQRPHLPPKKEKVCSLCKCKKTIASFAKDACRPDGFHVWCNECRKPKNVLYRMNFRMKHHERYSDKNRSVTLEKYNNGRELYDRLFEEQKGLCAICGKPQSTKGRKYLSIDHDHKTNKTRGLLCDRCNLGIGNLQDNSTLCRKAAQYLDSFK